jgi:aryl-alcohol dehydrogenase-like predicted oxidoreductase
MAKEMIYRELGKSGIKASVVGLGTFAIGGWFYGGTDEGKAVRAIEKSIELGVNLIDTAPIYGFGVAEEIVGKAIKGKRDKVVIASKVGLRWDTEKGQFDGYADDKSPSSKPAKYKIHRYLGVDSINFEIEQSLRRMKTDYIDLYQTHWQESTTPIEATMEALLKLQQQGKIRAIGVSNVSVEQAQLYRNAGAIVSVQEKYSLVDRGIEEHGLLRYCIDNSISVLSYFTLEQGLLSGTMSPDRTFRDGDTRKTNPKFRPENIQLVNDSLSKLEPFRKKYGVTLTQLIISLTFHQTGITHVLIGSRDEVQASENAGAGNLNLESSDVHKMNEIFAPLKQAFAQWK